MLQENVTELLDRGFYLVTYKNALGSYSSVAVGKYRGVIKEVIDLMPDDSPCITDHFSPTDSLNALGDKMGQPPHLAQSEPK